MRRVRAVVAREMARPPLHALALSLLLLLLLIGGCHAIKSAHGQEDLIGVREGGSG